MQLTPLLFGYMTRSDCSPTSAAPRKPSHVLLLHWLSAGMILIAFVLAWTHEAIDEKSIEILVMNVHRQAGLLALMLLVPRVIARHLASEPSLAPTWHEKLAIVSHIALYGLLLAMPILGWAMTNAQGHEVSLFQLLQLPNLIGANPEAADDLQDWHALLAKCLLGLISLHFSAALWHHFIRRDGVLASMWPMPK